MSKLKLIIQREFIAKVRNKSFIVMTFFKSTNYGRNGCFDLFFNPKK